MSRAANIVVMAGGRDRCVYRNAGGIPVRSSDTTGMWWLVGAPGMVSEVRS
jgi:hypothetical protein